MRVSMERGTRKAESAPSSPICALITTLGVFSGAPNNNEDCLYVNVFTPNLDPSARLPVIVWIHGGGNVDGETPGYDGSKLAAQGKALAATLGPHHAALMRAHGLVLVAESLPDENGESVITWAFEPRL